MEMFSRHPYMTTELYTGTTCLRVSLFVKSTDNNFDSKYYFLEFLKGKRTYLNRARRFFPPTNLSLCQATLMKCLLYVIMSLN